MKNEEKIQSSKPAHTPKAPVKARKKSMGEYVKKAKAKQNTSEANILKSLDKRAIDLKIKAYMVLKEEIKVLEKQKTILEGELDSRALDNGLELLGEVLHFSITTQSYDKVISKEEALKGGVWNEFVTRGFTKLSFRKMRKIVEVK